MCQGPKDVRAKTCRSCNFGQIGSHRQCTKCHKYLLIKEFRIRTRATPRPRSICKACEATDQRERGARRDKTLVRAKKREWYKKNPMSVKMTSLRTMCRKLNIPEKDIPVILDKFTQSTHCPICQRPIEEIGTLHLDHCHKSGKFRGFVCGKCNIGLGHFQDDPDRLIAAANYLQSSVTALVSESG